MPSNSPDTRLESINTRFKSIDMHSEFTNMPCISKILPILYSYRLGTSGVVVT